MWKKYIANFLINRPYESNKPKQFLTELFRRSLLASFPPDGYDPITTSYLERTPENNDVQRKIIHCTVYSKNEKFAASDADMPDVSNRLFLTSFFGIPNQLNADKNLTAKQVRDMNPVFVLKNQLKDQYVQQTVAASRNLTLKKVLLNFIGGWPPSTVGKITGLFLLPLRIVAVPFKTLLNVLKIATELIPRFLFHLTAWAMENLRHIAANEKVDHHANRQTGCNNKFKTANYNGLKRILAGVGFALLAIPHYVTAIWHLAGRAITSPVKSARAAKHMADVLFVEKYTVERLEQTSLGKGFDRIDKKSKTRTSAIGKVVGWILAGLSATFSIASYVLMPFIGFKVLAAKAPLFVSSVTSFLTNTPLISSVISNVGAFFLGIASVTAVAVGSVFSLVNDKLRAFFNSPKKDGEEILENRFEQDQDNNQNWLMSVAIIKYTQGSTSKHCSRLGKLRAKTNTPNPPKRNQEVEVESVYNRHTKQYSLAPIDPEIPNFKSGQSYTISFV